MEATTSRHLRHLRDFACIAAICTALSATAAAARSTTDSEASGGAQDPVAPPIEDDPAALPEAPGASAHEEVHPSVLPFTDDGTFAAAEPLPPAIAEIQSDAQRDLGPIVELGGLIDPTPRSSESGERPLSRVRLGVDRAKRARDATVLLAATTRDRRHGALQPVLDTSGAVTQWRVRATSAQQYFGICADDVLASQYRHPSVGFCTGVVVAPDLVLTAAHCLDEVRRVSDIRAVFDYAEGDNGKSPRVLRGDKVLSVVVEHRGDDDWALLRLVGTLPRSEAEPDGAAVGGNVRQRLPEVCRPGDACLARSGIFAVTHPLGMVRRYLPIGEIVSESETRMRTDLDVFAGSSGSPVFERETGRLLGIVVSGAVDFRRGRRACLRTHVAHRDARLRRGETVLPLSRIPADIRARIVGRPRTGK